jgi:replicative DNA helicase
MQEENVIFEEQLINILLTSRDAVKEWSVSVIGDVKFFEEVNTDLVRGILWAHFDGVLLTRNAYKTFLEGYKLSPAEMAAKMTIYNRCYMRLTKPDELPILIRKIRQSYIRRKSIEFIKQYGTDREQKGDLEANRILASKLTALETSASESKTAYVDIAENKTVFMEDLETRRKNPLSRLTCGIPEIDETMSVGFREGTLTIFCAAPGTFKTTIMMNVALNIFKGSGENVLFLPLEMPHEMMIQKIVSRETQIAFHKIEHAEKLNDAEIKKISEEFDKWHSLSNRFKILKISDRAKVSTIRAEIDRRFSYFQPRVVFIDYIDNVIPDRREARNDLELRGMFDDIIKMAEYYGFAAVTAAKLTRDSIKRMRESKDGELDSADVHGGQEFGGNATNMFGQIRNHSEPTSKLDFFCMKSRYGQNVFRGGKMKATLVVDPEVGYIKSPEDMTFQDAEAGLIDAASLPPPPTDDSPF